MNNRGVIRAERMVKRTDALRRRLIRASNNEAKYEELRRWWQAEAVRLRADLERMERA